MSGDRHDDSDKPRRLGQLAERFCRELREGRSPSVDDYVAQAPELADEIRDVFPAFELLEQTGGHYASPGTRSLSERIARAYGSEAEQSELISKIVRRLAGRGETYGRYQLKGEIARGGQGAVMRVWDDDLRRNLAMKIVLGMGDAPTGETPPVDSKTVGRFLEEAQVTGQLDHPGIVPVHELGLDYEGRVYFTMKLVKGRDLKAIFSLVHEENEGWNQTRALNVMLRVCEAMAYAHSKGVIHRDLKPANVMVGRYGEVYVMDWGLARIMGQEDGKDIRVRPALATDEVSSLRQNRGGEAPESALITMDGDVVGTPVYMSPEQAAGDLESMGPHSDVYSVGAMLYHLLAGQMPYVKPEMVVNNYSVWQRVQEGPPKPLHELAPGVPPELAAICDKAMAREVTARYADMQGLAEDLRALLEHRVVGAYETGAAAELRKWVTRNKGLAIASAAAVLALVAGLATSSSLYVKAKQNAKEASANATQAQINEEAMRNGREEARFQRDSAQELSDFWNTMMEVAVPSAEPGRGRDVKLKGVLDAAAHRIDDWFADKPSVEASIRWTFGRTYHSLGEYREAEAHLSRALTLSRSELGELHPQTVSALNSLAILYKNQDRYEEAEPLYQESLEKSRRLLGDDHLDTLRLIINLANLYRFQGRNKEAESLLEQCLDKYRREHGVNHRLTLGAMNNLASVYADQGRLVEAEQLHIEALEIRRNVLGDHPETLQSMQNLASAYRARGHYEEAEALYQECLQKSRRILGPTHPDTLACVNNMAALNIDQGLYDEAERLYSENLDVLHRELGDHHGLTLGAANNLAVLYKTQGFHEKAEPLLLDCIEKARQHPEGNGRTTLGFVNNLGNLYLAQGRLEDAEPLFLECLEGLRQALGPEHPEMLTSLGNLAELYDAQGRHEDAEPLFRECLATRRRVLGNEHPDTIRSIRSLADFCAKTGRPEEALQLHEECLEILTSYNGEEDLWTLITASTLAWFLVTTDSPHRDAERALSLALRVNELTNHENPDFLDTLALAYSLTGAVEAAVETQTRALDWLPEEASALRTEMEARLAEFKAALPEVPVSECD